MAKLSDKEFLAVLRESAGLYSRTVRMIKKVYDIDISRQAVRERALKHPEELEDIREENIDIAEEGLHGLIRSRNENIKLRACETYLKTIGRTRGYVEGLDLTTKGESFNYTPEERERRLLEYAEKRKNKN